MTRSPKSIDVTKISTRPDMRFLRSVEFPLERDLYSLAVAIFEAEKAAKLGEQSLSCTVPISFAGYSDLDLDTLSGVVEDLFSSIYPVDASFRFRIADTRVMKRKSDVDITKVDAVVLFSGGIDSLAAILEARRHFDSVCGVFVAHSDQSGVIHVVNGLKGQVLDPMRIPLQTIYAPPMGGFGYSQLRGFLYIVCALLYANAASAEAVVVGECGPTMYQPQFGPFDSVTMTSHPIVLEAGASVGQLLPNGAVRLVTPFEDMTKAETLAVIEDKNLIPNTHSCVTQRFRDHDGTCYGCVLRRLATTLIDSPDVEYKKKVLSDPTAKIDNLVSLMRFCYDVVVDPEGMPAFSSVLIEEYGKEELADRFAMDVFAGIQVAGENGVALSPNVSKAFDAMSSSEIQARIPERISEVRNAQRKPIFD